MATHKICSKNGECPDGWAPRVALAIRETVFGRDAGHERGDDDATRACEGMDCGHAIDGDGQREHERERNSGSVSV